MKPALQLRLGQSLALTPQLQQAIRLLQLSRLELELELNTALESNPLLDMEDGESEEGDDVDAAASESETEPVADTADSDEQPLDLELDRSDYR